MRTRIACGWLVANEDGHHTLWRNAELVYEGNIGERFEGPVDHEIDARDKLVAPGFIDTHVHSGHRALHRLISDVGRGDYFGHPFLEISVAREGARVGGDPRYARPDDRSAAEELRLNTRFTVAELLRNGITIFVEFGSQLRIPSRPAGAKPDLILNNSKLARAVSAGQLKADKAEIDPERHSPRLPTRAGPASDAHNGRLDLQTRGRGKAFRFALWTTKNNYRYLSGGRIAVASTSMRYEGSARRVICSSVEAGSAPLLAKKDARTSR
jgi:Amidohydrolase family